MSPLIRSPACTLLTTGRARNCAISRFRCFRSKTSTSISMTEKSGADLVILRLEMLPSLSAMTWAIWASVPGSLIAVTSIRAGKRSRFSSSMSQRTSSQRSGSSSNSFSAGDWIGIDGDPLARRHDADDALAGHRAALGEAHRHLAVRGRGSGWRCRPASAAGAAATGRARGTSCPSRASGRTSPPRSAPCSRGARSSLWSG